MWSWRVPLIRDGVRFFAGAPCASGRSSVHSVQLRSPGVRVRSAGRSGRVSGVRPVRSALLRVRVRRVLNCGCTGGIHSFCFPCSAWAHFFTYAER